MSFASGRLTAFVVLGFALLLPGCGGRGGGQAVPAVRGGPLEMVKSVSPASIAAPPMVLTPIQPSSVMLGRRPKSDIAPLGFTQIPGGGIWVSASPDGSIWVLSSVGSGPDRAIWHYANGNWTNIPGAAMRMAVAPDLTLWVVNSAGGIYSYANGSWTGIAGGASDITVGSDGSVYVVSNQGGGPYGRGIWHYASGTWTQMPGAALTVASNWDAGTYPGNIAPGGIYVINAIKSIYYYNPSTGFSQIPGAAGQLAATTNGGLFALGYQANPDGSYPIYYDNIATNTWTQQQGAGTTIATNTTNVYVTGAAGGIYVSPVKPPTSGGGGNAPPLAGPTYGPGTNGGWGPAVVANAFNFPVQSGFDGTGSEVAIVMDSAIVQSDLAAYLSYFQTPQTNRQFRTVAVDALGTPGPTGTGSQDEATLDVETVAGLAPGANITLYVIPDLSDQSIIDGYAQILSDGRAKVVSSSFGGCESGPGTTQNKYTTVFQNGANNGVAFIASSGDQGNECYSGEGAGVSLFAQGVNYPASDPNVIGVGGTQTHRPQALTNPVAWNESFGGSQVATGGGVSTYFALPSYQSGLAGAASSQKRNVPDIAMPATWDAAYDSNSGSPTNWAHFAGTSWSAPMFAAMLAEIYQYCNASFQSPVTLPYYVFQQKGYQAFLDITSGTNQYNSTTPFYTAQPGYDNTTGIGVPLGMPFANTICPNRVPVSRLRSPMAVTAPRARRSAQAYRVDLSPTVRGLVDRGRRPASAATRIQLVLEDSPSLAADEQAVIATLRGAGFTIVKTFANHLVVDAEAPSATVEAVFATQLHDVAQGRFGTTYMPAAPATVPASLAPYVSGISLDRVVTKAHR